MQCSRISRCCSYVDLIHDDISILPRSFETVQNHVSKCSPKLASAFTYALAVACGSKPSDEHYASDTEFDEYAWMNARVSPLNRSVSENIVWLWVYTFMIVNSNADIARLRGIEKQVSKRTILKMAIDLGQYLLEGLEQNEIEQTDGSLDPTRSIVRRTWRCMSIFAQLHAIGTGTEDLSCSSESKSLASPAECRALLSESAAFLDGE